MSQDVEAAFKGGGFSVEDIDYEDLITPEDAGDEHRLIAKTTRDFVASEVVPKLGALESHDFKQAVALFREAGELGLLSAEIPEQYGGIGLDQIGSALITENFATAQGFAVAHNIHVGVGTLPIVYFGNEQQKQKYLPQIATGEKIAAYALTEPGSGSDALAAKTTATLDEKGTHYILNGEKQWITNASIADIFIVFAKVNRTDFTAFIVERESEGLSTGPEEKKMGIHSCSTATLILDEVRVPKENVIWKAGKGHLVALNILNIARYKMGVMGLGQAKKALQLAVKYAKERHQFQTSIASFPLMQEKLADMTIHIYAAESTLYRTSGLLKDQLAGVDYGAEEHPEKAAGLINEYLIECALNKFYATEMLSHVVDEALQIHGGYGYMAEYEIETIYRDARIDRIFEGTNEINRLAAGRALIKKMIKDKSFADAMSRTDASEEEDNPSQTPILAQEKRMLKSAKKMFRKTFAATFQKYGKQLDDEQELLSKLADIMSEVYAMESVIYRTEKNVITGNVNQHQQKILITEVFCRESLERIILFAKKVTERVQDKETSEMIRSDDLKNASIDCIGKKREMTVKLLEKEGYTV